MQTAVCPQQMPFTGQSMDIGAWSERDSNPPVSFGAFVEGLFPALKVTLKT